MSLSTAVQQEYRKQRAKGIHPRNALEVARNMQAPTWPQLEPHGDNAFLTTWEGFDIEVRVNYDEYPDTSWAGEFSQTWQPGAIQNPDWRPHGQGRAGDVYRWFIPERPWGTDEENEPHLVRAGLARHDRWLTIQRYIREDYEIARGGDERPQWVITAEASIEGIVLGADSLHGVDMGKDWHPAYASKDDIHELDMVASDVISEAVSQARGSMNKLIEHRQKQGAL